MLKIGFSTQYYTLWSVSSNISYIGGLPYEKGTYMYHQNLSTDLSSAIEKAKSMGCTCLEVDNDLYGRNSRFDFERKLFTELNANNASWFWFGKYKGQPIFKCEDTKYLIWYLRATEKYGNENPIVLKILDTLGYCKFGQKWVLKSEWLEHVTKAEIAADFARHVRETGVLQCEFNSNLNYDGSITIEIKDTCFHLHFPNIVQMTYNGHGYALPKLGDKGKKIKGKELEMKLQRYEGEIQNSFKVLEFKIC